jgi:hypothetical protein
MYESDDVLAGGDGVGALEIGEGGSDDFGEPRDEGRFFPERFGTRGVDVGEKVYCACLVFAG